MDDGRENYEEMKSDWNEHAASKVKTYDIIKEYRNTEKRRSLLSESRHYQKSIYFICICMWLAWIISSASNINCGIHHDNGIVSQPNLNDDTNIRQDNVRPHDRRNTFWINMDDREVPIKLYESSGIPIHLIPTLTTLNKIEGNKHEESTKYTHVAASGLSHSLENKILKQHIPNKRVKDAFAEETREEFLNKEGSNSHYEVISELKEYEESEAGEMMEFSNNKWDPNEIKIETVKVVREENKYDATTKQSEEDDEVITIPTRNAPGNGDDMVEKRLESSLDANEVQYEQIARSYEELTAFEGDIFDDYVSKIGMYSFPEILMGKTDKKATDRDKKKVYEIPNESGIKRFELYHRGYVDVHLAYKMDITDKINPLIYYDPCDTNDMKLRDISSVNEVDEEWDYRNEDAARKVGIDKELEQSKPSMHDMQSIPSTSAPQIGTIKNTLTDTILQNGLKDRTESIDINPNDLSRPLLIEHYQLHYSERVNSTTSHGEVRRQYKERDVKLFEDLVCEYNVNSTPPKTEDHDSSLVSNKKAKREQLASQSLREEENRAYVDDLDVHRESRMKYKVKMASLNPEIEGINAERKAMNEHDVCRLDHDSVMDALNDVVQLEDFLYLCETYVDHEDSDPDYAVRFDANDCEESEQGKLEREDNQDEMFNIGGFDYSTQEEEEIDLNSTEFCKESEEALAVVRRVAKIGQQSLVNSVCNMRNDWVDEEPNEQQLSQSDEQSDEHNLSKSEAPEHDLPSDYASKEEEVKDNGEENLIDESESEVKVFEEEEKLAWNKEEMIKSEPFEREWKDGALIKIKTDNVGKSDQLILPKFVAACEQILITDNVYLVDDFDRMRAYHSDPQTSQIKKQQKQENEEEFNGKEAVQERCAMLHFEDENSEYYGDAMNEIDKKANDIFCNAFHIKPVQLIDLNVNTFLHLMTKQKFGMTKEVVQSLRYVSDTRMTNKNGHTFLQIAAKNNQEYIYRAVMDDSSLYGSNVIQIKEGQCVIQRVVNEKEPDYAGAAYLVIKCSIPLDEEVVSREELSTKYEEQKAKRGDKMRQLENAHVDTQEENDRDCEDETLGWIVTKVHYDPKKRGKPLYNIMNSITAA
eukprot:659044_1